MEIKELNFQITKSNDQILYTANVAEGRFTVLDRVNGLGFRQIESGYLDNEHFYLINGDIRLFGWTIPEAIEKFKSSSYAASRG